jgi:hypothetical protein
MVEDLVEMIRWYETPENATRMVGAQVPLPPLQSLFDVGMDVIIEAGLTVTPTEMQLQQTQMMLQSIAQFAPFLPPIVAGQVGTRLLKRMMELAPLEDVEQVWNQIEQAMQQAPPEMLLPPGAAGNVPGPNAGPGQPRPETVGARGGALAGQREGGIAGGTR